MSFSAQNRDFADAYRFHQKGDLRQAEKLYRKSLKKNPRLMEAYLNLGMLLQDQGRGPDGIRMMERGLEMDPRHMGLLSALSSTFISMGQTEAARKHSQALVTYHPDKAEAYYNLANLEMMSQAFPQAIKLYDKAIELNMKFTQAYYNKGLVHYQLRELQEAQTSFRSCMSIDPSMTAAKVNLARVLAEQAEYVESKQLLEEVIEKEPGHANAHQQLGMVMHLTSDLASAENLLKKALELGEVSSELQTLLGNVYRDLGDEKKAVAHYDEALKLDPDNKVAGHNIDRVSGAKIAAWHLDMLADGERNRIYHKAIKANVKSGDVVFDIGAGTGLLSMMAARAGAKEVLAIEVMEVITENARKIVKLNNLEDTVKLVDKRSTSMIEGEDFTEKADIIVSEILDAGLLGEGVLPTLRHAHASLLKPGGKVLPQGAIIECFAIEMEDLRQTVILENIEGFDLSSFRKFLTTDNSRATNLRGAPHTALSATKEVKTFDFRDLPSIASETEPHREAFQLEIAQDGTLHGIAFWFILLLDDTIRASTGPEGEMIHWNQIVYFFEKPEEVKKGDVIDFDICNSETRIWFERKTN